MTDVLSSLDKRVLVELVHHSDYSDTKLSEILQITPARAKSIRHKLLSNRYITPVNIPDFAGIGCELLTVFHGDFNAATPYNMRKKYLPSQKFKHVFLVATTDLQHVSMSASNNFTDIRRYVEYMEMVYGKHGFLGTGGNNYVYFPFELSKILHFFNFGPLLSHHFGEQPSKSSLGVLLSQKKFCRLGINEKKVLYLLVKNPCFSDRNLANEIGISRQTVNNIRNKIFKKGLIHPIMFPNLSKLGFDLLVFKYCRYKPSSPLDVREEKLGSILKKPSRILTISSNLESVSFSVFRDYQEYEKDKSDYLTTHQDYFKGDPFIRVFPVKELRFTYARYAPLVAKVLGFDEEFN
ncbi:MAG: Lrp/AsnC family transcriptional regulator [Candidatus Altiarchaeota archaeon]